MTNEERERILDRLLESHARWEERHAKWEERQALEHAEWKERQDKWEERQDKWEERQNKWEENQAVHEANLQRLEELQMQNQVAISRLNNQIANYTEQHHTTLLSFAEENHNALMRLEALVEAFIRGSRHNGGSQQP